MHLSLVLSSLPLDFRAALRQAVSLGFTHVDVVALADRPEAHREALADSGLLVSGAAVGKGLPAGHTPDAGSVEVRRSALVEMKRQVAEAARLGATCGYLTPGPDSSERGLAYFTESCTLLADYAARRMVRLCIEPLPGSALASIPAAAEWLDRVGCHSLGLRVDVGCCLGGGEDPAEAVLRAGERLGNVRLSDNLTAEVLERTLNALRQIQFDGDLSLEADPRHSDPGEWLRRGKAQLEVLLRNQS